jgi:hypothetical protein
MSLDELITLVNIKAKQHNVFFTHEIIGSEVCLILNSEIEGNRNAYCGDEESVRKYLISLLTCDYCLITQIQGRW